MKNFLGKINLTAHYSVNDKTNWKKMKTVSLNPLERLVAERFALHLRETHRSNS